MNNGKRPGQKVFSGNRTYIRVVSDIEGTPFGLRGKVCIKGQDLVARHWHGDTWSAGESWRPYPGGKAND